jgi:hypothetical protein
MRRAADRRSWGPAFHRARRRARIDGHVGGGIAQPRRRDKRCAIVEIGSFPDFSAFSVFWVNRISEDDDSHGFHPGNPMCLFKSHFITFA